jgi:ppGpp synthetase/RelA/SpoT-type nucleotidyltranferase
MKIRAELRDAYAAQRPGFEQLKALVDDILRPMCHSRRWHYESRVKEELSYALKIETGRVSGLDSLEDFLGCSIVVRNSGDIGPAVTLVESRFAIEFRRPPDPRSTPHRPSTFEFDDLRLYVKLKNDPSINRSMEDYRLFEVQIKTFLFHAWAIATHDLIYKADHVSWGRERIAFQVRAMLEHTEITIQRADQLADIEALNKKDRRTEELLAIIAELRARWSAPQLPSDVRRLAENIRGVLGLVRVSQDRWRALLDSESEKGPLPLDENPYQVTVRLLFENEGEKMKEYIENPQGRARVVVYETVPVPEWFDAANTHNLLRLS